MLLLLTRTFSEDSFLGEASVSTCATDSLASAASFSQAMLSSSNSHEVSSGADTEKPASWLPGLDRLARATMVGAAASWSPGVRSGSVAAPADCGSVRSAGAGRGGGEGFGPFSANCHDLPRLPAGDLDGVGDRGPKLKSALSVCAAALSWGISTSAGGAISDCVHGARACATSLGA